MWLTVQATVSLFLDACRDPGIVLDADICANLFGEDALNGPGTSHRGGYSGLDNHAQGEEEGWRYCGVYVRSINRQRLHIVRIVMYV